MGYLLWLGGEGYLVGGGIFDDAATIHRVIGLPMHGEEPKK
jgi:hypothetical protein